MIRRTHPGRIGVVASTLLACAPVLAATASTTGTQSTCTDCTVLVDWNPTFDCSDPIADGDDLVSCLFESGPPGCHSNSIEEPTSPPDAMGGSPFPQDLQERPDGSEESCLVSHETGNYWVTPLEDPPPYGLNIRREDDTEIDRLHFWENYPEIRWIEVHVDRPDRIARIAEIVGTPSEGLIVVTLNGRIVQVDTAFENSAAEVTEALVQAMQFQGFEVALVRPYIEVLRDARFDVGLTRVAFESTDPGIVQSEIALEPPRLRPPVGNPSFGP